MDWKAEVARLSEEASQLNELHRKRKCVVRIRDWVHNSMLQERVHLSGPEEIAVAWVVAEGMVGILRRP
jgi:hypothetical protein